MCCETVLFFLGFWDLKLSGDRDDYLNSQIVTHTKVYFFPFNSYVFIYIVPKLELVSISLKKSGCLYWRVGFGGCKFNEELVKKIFAWNWKTDKTSFIFFVDICFIFNLSTMQRFLYIYIYVYKWFNPIIVDVIQFVKEMFSFCGFKWILLEMIGIEA